MPTTMIHVPTTVDEFRPPKSADLITEGTNFLRAHWDEVRQYFQMISGEIESKHGSLQFDEAECAFFIKEKAVANGFALLGTVSTADLWRALRYAYKRNTGIAVGKLEKQNKTLRVERRHEQASQVTE